MKLPTPVFQGAMDDTGRLMLLSTEQPARQRYYKTLAGKRVSIKVVEWKDVRSQQANNYWWYCLDLAIEILNAGDQKAEDLHDAFCEMFLPNERKRVAFFNRMTGARLEVECEDTRRSSKLTGEPFYVFVEKGREELRRLGVETPDPDPAYWRKRASKAA